MKYINERYMDRIRELGDKSYAYIVKKNIPSNLLEGFKGFYGNQYGGIGGASVNGLSEDEKKELLMYGLYTEEDLFKIQRDS